MSVLVNVHVLIFGMNAFWMLRPLRRACKPFHLTEVHIFLIQIAPSPLTVALLFLSSQSFLSNVCLLRIVWNMGKTQNESHSLHRDFFWIGGSVNSLTFSINSLGLWGWGGGAEVSHLIELVEVEIKKLLLGITNYFCYCWYLLLDLQCALEPRQSLEPSLLSVLNQRLNSCVQLGSTWLHCVHNYYMNCIPQD